MKVHMDGSYKTTFLLEFLFLRHLHCFLSRHLPVPEIRIHDSKWQFLSVHVLVRQSRDPVLTSKLSKLCLMAHKLPHGTFINLMYLLRPHYLA